MPPSSSSAYQCLSCRLSRLSIANKSRQFHVSSRKHVRKSPYPSVKAADLGLLNPVASNAHPVLTRPYTDREKELLATKYTPEQLAIIDIGEEAIPSEDMAKQGLQRTDPMRISYYDDFSTARPIIDYPVGEAQPDAKEASKVEKEERLDNESEVNLLETTDPHLLRLMQQTGLDREGIRKIRVKNLVSHRVVNQTRLGKIQSLYFLTIAGTQDGMLGVGEGKASEAEDGRRQSIMAAIRNMKPILRYENRTIFGDVQGKVAATVVQLFQRPPGFGNRCQSLIFEMGRAAGIHDLAARTPRSRNKMNVVKAAYKALMSQRNPEDVAKARGKKMVDVRKVYYGRSIS